VTKAFARDPIYRGRRFQSEIIELCARWYLTYGLRYRDLVAMMAERGVTLSHTTIFVGYSDTCLSSRAAGPGTPSPCIRLGEWMRQQSLFGEARLIFTGRWTNSARRSIPAVYGRSEAAARAFFCKTLETHKPRRPLKVNLDGNAAGHQALREARSHLSVNGTTRARKPGPPAPGFAHAPHRSGHRGQRDWSGATRRRSI
jgi:putative transposase